MHRELLIRLPSSSKANFQRRMLKLRKPTDRFKTSTTRGVNTVRNRQTLALNLRMLNTESALLPRRRLLLLANWKKPDVLLRRKQKQDRSCRATWGTWMLTSTPSVNSWRKSKSPNQTCSDICPRPTPRYRCGEPSSRERAQLVLRNLKRQSKFFDVLHV